MGTAAEEGWAVKKGLKGGIARGTEKPKGHPQMKTILILNEQTSIRRRQEKLGIQEGLHPSNDF